MNGLIMGLIIPVLRVLPIPFISHGPLIFWLYPLLGIRGARAGSRQ